MASIAIHAKPLRVSASVAGRRSESRGGGGRGTPHVSPTLSSSAMLTMPFPLQSRSPHILSAPFLSVAIPRMTVSACANASLFKWAGSAMLDARWCWFVVGEEAGAGRTRHGSSAKADRPCDPCQWAVCVADINSTLIAERAMAGGAPGCRASSAYTPSMVTRYVGADCT